MTSRKQMSRKRKQVDDHQENDEEMASPSSQKSLSVYTLFGGWLDDGTKGRDGVVEHQGFTLTLGGTTFDISIGDAVLMRSDPQDNQSNSAEKKAGAHGMIARVERIWEAKNIGVEDCPFMFQARWFLRKQDLDALQGDVAVPSWDLDFSKRLSEDDLILSNQTDDNAVTSIVGDIQVVYRRPESDPVLPSLPPDMYVCRHCVSFGDRADDGVIRIIPFVGKDDKWTNFVTSTGGTAVKKTQIDKDTGNQHLPVISIPTTPTAKRPRYSPESNDSSDTSSSDESIQPGNAVIGEGAIDQRNTRVGAEHQVVVPRFNPDLTPTIISRNPKLVWKPGKASTHYVQSFMAKAASILIPYLKRKGLTYTDPYSPLSLARMENLTKELGMNKLPTLSTICTASALSKNRTDMLREVDADALMKLLHDHGYNSENALRSLEASPKKFVMTMTYSQKEVVDAAFRRYAGSLRMIYKALAPAKTFKDVIDYVYRYKIPDQFRLFQETKREQAVRMLECIENRRNINSNINVCKDPNSEQKSTSLDWQKTSMTDATASLDERRSQAKRLLLDIEEELGSDTMREVTLLIKSFHQRPAIEARSKLIGMLHGADSLKERMMDFLPKRF